MLDACADHVAITARDEKKGQAALEKFKAEGLQNGAILRALLLPHFLCAVSYIVFDVTDSKAGNSAVDSIL